MSTGGQPENQTKLMHMESLGMRPELNCVYSSSGSVYGNVSLAEISTEIRALTFILFFLGWFLRLILYSCLVGLCLLAPPLWPHPLFFLFGASGDRRFGWFLLRRFGVRCLWATCARHLRTSFNLRETSKTGYIAPRPLPDFISQPWQKIRRTRSRTGNGGLSYYVTLV